VLATADISRIKSGPHSDYKVRLEEDVSGSVGTATLRDYPRYSAWDLVARGIAAAIAGKEELPPTPLLPRARRSLSRLGGSLSREAGSGCDKAKVAVTDSVFALFSILSRSFSARSLFETLRLAC
jgi:hypothetical protein